MTLVGALARRRRSQAPPGRRRAPLLVLRFAVVSALVVGVAAAVILLVVRGLAVTQAQRSANETTRVVSTAVLQPELRPADLRRPVEGTRRAELDRLFRDRLLTGDTQAVTLVRADGLVTYSTNHALIGADMSSVLGDEAAGGELLSAVVDEEGAGGKVLRTFVPIGVSGSAAGIAVVDRDYGPVAAAARDVFFPVAAVLEALLVVLFIALVPLLRRASVRIQRQIDEIEHAAYHDDLTGLPNRAHLRREVDELLAGGAPDGRCAVLVLDVNDFKDVNDTLGHEGGDVLLLGVAERLASALGRGEQLAHLGGDEFAVVLPGAGESDAVAVSRELLELFAVPVVSGELPLAVAVSIGVALAPEHGEDAGMLLKHAYVATHKAKEMRAGYAVYDVASDRRDPEHLRLFADLRHALAAGELTAFYQPKASLADNSIVGVEALVRWEHPERGLISPAEFVPMAEKTGLMGMLTRRVLEVAVGQLQLWQGLGFDVRVAVNLSSYDLLDPDLPAEISRLAEARGVELSSVELEITESAAMVDPVRTRETLLQLSRLGATLAVDDFGTGHSSLAYLTSLPVDVLKIDQSFVQGMTRDRDSATIVRSTVELGRNLGLKVIAEGVESTEQWAALRRFGCDEAQGYLIGAPMPADELTAWLVGLEARGATSLGSFKAA